MKIARSLTTLAAASALALGAVVSPIASASDIDPDEIRGNAEKSQISDIDLYDELEEYLPKDEAGNPLPSREEYEAALNDRNTNFSEPKINKLPEKKKWMGYVFRYGEYRQLVKPLKATAPAMDRDVPLAVLTPDGTFDASRPTIYLLNGAGGAEQGMDWISSTFGKDLDPKAKGVQHLPYFYANRNVNVVIPQAGAFSYYTDWLSTPDRGYLKGPQKWETFLTKELPGPLEDRINGNGKRGIAGMSMSATSSLVLAQHNPNFYDAVGSYSGCAATSTPLPNFYAQLTVNRGGGSTEQMWGAKGGDYNRYNDGLINATKNNMGNSKVYVSANSGLAGATDLGSSKIDALGSSQAFKSSSTLVVEGGVIEAAMNACTHDLKTKMEREGVDAVFNMRNTGTHSWPGWYDDVNSSWPTFARAFGLPVDPSAPVAATYAADEDTSANEMKAEADSQDAKLDEAEANNDAPADSLPVDTEATEH